MNSKNTSIDASNLDEMVNLAENLKTPVRAMKIKRQYKANHYSSPASTSQDEPELSRQRKAGVIKRVPRRTQPKNQRSNTSSTSNQTAERQAVPGDQNSCQFCIRRSRAALSSDMGTSQYDNLSDEYYRTRGNDNSPDPTGNNSAPDRVNESLLFIYKESD